MEEHPSGLQVDSARGFDDVIQKVSEESSLLCTEARSTYRPHAETSTSSDMGIEFCGNKTVEDSSRSVAASRKRKCGLKEIVPPYQVSAGHSRHESYSDRNNTASTSFVEQQSSDPVSVNVSANK